MSGFTETFICICTLLHEYIFLSFQQRNERGQYTTVRGSHQYSAQNVPFIMTTCCIYVYICHVCIPSCNDWVVCIPLQLAKDWGGHTFGGCADLCGNNHSFCWWVSLTGFICTKYLYFALSWKYHPLTGEVENTQNFLLTLFCRFKPYVMLDQWNPLHPKHMVADTDTYF